MDTFPKTFICQTKLGEIIFRQQKKPWNYKQYKTNSYTFNKDHESFGKFKNVLELGAVSSLSSRKSSDCEGLAYLAQAVDVVESLHTRCGDFICFNERPSTGMVTPDVLLKGQYRGYPSRYFYN